MKLLEGRELTDALAGLAFVRGLADVDPRRIAVVGHSFGGSLTVLMTEREPALRAAVVFSGAGYSWDRSRDLRERLLAAVHRTSVPLFFLHAENDFSTNSGKALAAELTRLGKPNRLKIYPPVGKTPEEGHDFPLNSIPAWNPTCSRFSTSSFGSSPSSSQCRHDDRESASGPLLRAGAQRGCYRARMPFCLVDGRIISQSQTAPGPIVRTDARQRWPAKQAAAR